MAVIAVKGDPTLDAEINDSGGTDGQFRVVDAYASNTVLQVSTSGQIQVHGSIMRDSAAAPLRLWNRYLTETGIIVEFRMSDDPIVTRVNLGYDDSDNFAYIESAQSGDCLRLASGQTVQINRSSGNGEIAEFKTGGTTRLSITGSSSDVVLQTGVDGDELILQAYGSTVWSAIQLEGTDVKAISKASSGSKIMRFYNASSTPVERGWISDTGAGDMVIASHQNNLFIEVASTAGKEVTLGWSGRQVLRVPYTTGDASVDIVDTSANSAITLVPEETNGYSGVDARAQIGTQAGTDHRGLLRVMNDGTNGAPGLVEMRADDGSSVFLSVWWNSSSSWYELWATRSDPETSRPTGTSGEVMIASGI